MTNRQAEDTAVAMLAEQAQDKQAKRRRTRKFKEDYVKENAELKMRLTLTQEACRAQCVKINALEQELSKRQADYTYLNRLFWGLAIAVTVVCLVLAAITI